MLTLVIPGIETFNDATGEFTTIGDTTVKLEHSLLALSKWEAKHKKPFLTNTTKELNEILDYVLAMILEPEPSMALLDRFSEANFALVNEYLESKESATTFSQTKRPTGRREIITSELIYYWMVRFNIPFECEHWNLNRLFNLIQICSIKNSKQPAMSPSELAARNREINAQRRAKLGTTG